MQKLTDAEKYELKLAIARDVLDTLDKRQYRTLNGYVVGELPKTISTTDEVKDHIQEIEKSCTFCFLGSCVLSLAKLKDEFKINQLLSWGGDSFNGTVESNSIFLQQHIAKEYLENVYRIDELAAMEAAFEGCFNCGYFTEKFLQHVANRNDIYAAEDYLKKAVAFTKDCETIEDRVRAIMNNVIEWEGDFHP